MFWVTIDCELSSIRNIDTCWSVCEAVLAEQLHWALLCATDQLLPQGCPGLDETSAMGPGLVPGGVGVFAKTVLVPPMLQPVTLMHFPGAIGWVEVHRLCSVPVAAGSQVPISLAEPLAITATSMPAGACTEPRLQT